MKSFILMLQFFTRIPINKTIDIKEGDFPKGIVFFPLIGLIVGVINGIVYYFVSKIVGGFIPLILVLLVNAIVTGALHLDGLADTCDGVFSARKRERMLEIMRDSAIGTNGMLGLFFLLILKLAFLDIVPKEIILPTIILTPVVGRTVMATTIYRAKYARAGEGLGDLFIGKTTLKQTIITLIMGLVLSYGLLKLPGILCLTLVLPVGYMLQRFFTNKLGGLTGDLLGAINEVTELVSLPSFILIYRIWGHFQ